MLALRNKRNGKFLRYFSGSLNYQNYGILWHNKPLELLFDQNIDGNIKIYKTKGGITNAFYSHNFKQPWQEKFPWIEIVEVVFETK